MYIKNKIVYLQWEGRSYQPDSWAADEAQLLKWFPGPVRWAMHDVGVLLTLPENKHGIGVVGLRHGEIGDEGLASGPMVLDLVKYGVNEQNLQAAIATWRANEWLTY